MLPLLKFEPLLKRIRWGGRRLGTVLNKKIGPGSDYAESWEVADLADGQSIVSGGPFHGRTLSSMIDEHGDEIFGETHGPRQFPVLVKFLDANDWLSLQVHPDNQRAKSWSPSDNGKTEAWVIVDALPGSRICAGLKQGVTEADIRDRLKAGQIEDLLHIIPVAAGDCFFIPAGTVHAIGPGILLAEVQQQSNLTFRLHDWGRVDAAGNSRPVHLEESLACIDFETGPVSAAEPRVIRNGVHAWEELIRCDYFVVCRHQSERPFSVSTQGHFRILMTLEGSGEVLAETGRCAVSRGQTILLPASLQDVQIIPETPMTLLEISCP